MVDVSAKDETQRTATAFGRVRVNKDTFELIRSGGLKKGDVLSVARLAGIMGAKRTADLIPLCHNITLSGVEVELELGDLCIAITSTTRCTGATGVEMEALTAVSVAALTIYDMCKSVQRDIEITDIHLLMKSGGKSGEYRKNDE